MGDLIYRGSCFIYTEGKKERVLLDCSRFLDNKSRLSMHCLEGQELRTIPAFLAELMETESRDREFKLVAAILDVLVAARLVRTSQPVRVLEYGCTGGRLSRHLAEVLGMFHEQSVLVCACDRIDTEWLEQVAGVSKPPRLSFFAGDYGNLALARQYFDIVLINGMADLADSVRVMEDALKLVKEGGQIFCFCDHMPLLEDMFRLFFKRDSQEEYEITPFLRVLSARASDRDFVSWEERKKTDSGRRIMTHVKRAQEILAGGDTDVEEITNLLKGLLQDIQETAMQGDVRQKTELLDLKERLMEYKLRQDFRI